MRTGSHLKQHLQTPLIRERPYTDIGLLTNNNKLDLYMTFSAVFQCLYKLLA